VQVRRTARFHEPFSRPSLSRCRFRLPHREGVRWVLPTTLSVRLRPTCDPDLAHYRCCSHAWGVASEISLICGPGRRRGLIPRLSYGPNWVLIKPSAASARTAHRLPLSPLQILMPVITSNRVRAASPRQGAQPIASRDARSVGFLSRLPRSGNVQLARRPRHGPEPLYGEARRNPADLARAAN
jgi:hypothetical protein